MTIKIVIDAGHGGHDPGTTGGGIIEKDYQLKAVLMFKERLEAQYEVEAVLTRATDVFVPLLDRAAVANSMGTDTLFVSFHHDASVSSTPRGGSIYVYGPQSWVKSTGQYAPRSYQVAKTVEPIFRDALAAFGVPYNGIKDGNFTVLRETKGRAILMEMFFATNPTDAAIAKKPEFLDAMVDAYVLAFATALELPKKKVEVATAPATPFIDVPANAWYADAVRELTEIGVVTGTDKGEFLPDEPMTRAQAAVMLRRLKRYLESK